MRARTLALSLLGLLVVLALISPNFGSTEAVGSTELVRGLGAMLGLSEPLEGGMQTIVV